MGNYFSKSTSCNRKYLYAAGYDSEEWYSICDSNTDYYKIEVRELPLEIWAHIVSFLNLRDRVNLSCVSLSMRSLVLTEIILELKAKSLKSPVLSHSYEASRKSVLMISRIQSAMHRNILEVENAGLILQLQSYYDKGTCYQRSTRDKFINWGWRILSFGAVETKNKCVTVNTCEELEKLEEYQSLKYEELKMNGVCLEGHEGFFRGYCKHDYRPINDLICYLPASLRALKFVNKSLYLASRKLIYKYHEDPF